MSSNHKKSSLSDSNSGFPLPAISEAFPSLLVWKATAASEAFFSPQLPTRGWKASRTAAVFFLFSCRYALRTTQAAAVFQDGRSKSDAHLAPHNICAFKPPVDKPWHSLVL